jgi:hypothetical protein
MRNGQIMKKCAKCLITKPASEFYKDKQLLDGLRTYCKLCWNAKSVQWGKDNKSYKNELMKIWRKKNPYKVLKAKRKAVYKAQYGMTLEEVEIFKQVRDNKCDICKESYKKMVIDHCHITGKVRGLLCDKCNRGIGLLKDSSEVCKKAAIYLEDK